MPSRLISTSPRQRENLKTLITQAGSSIMFEGVLTQRQGYAEAVSLKQPVWTINKTAAKDAAREIQQPHYPGPAFVHSALRHARSIWRTSRATKAYVRPTVVTTGRETTLFICSVSASTDH